MKKILFTLGVFITLLGQFGSVLAQRNISNSDRRKIEQELERQISTDNRSNIRVRILTADAYSISNRETGVRGQATVEGRGNNRNEIWYETIIDSRRNAITNTTWGYGRNQNTGGGYNQGPASGPLSNGRYEIQLVATKRMLVAGSNGQVIQSNSGNARGQQWDIEDAGSGYYYIRSAQTGEVMTYEGRGDRGDTIVLTNQRRNRDEQLWEIRTGPDNGYYFIARNGKAMDSPSSARQDGGRMQLYDRNGEANQRFWLRRVGDSDSRYDDRSGGRYRDRDRYDDRSNQGRGSSSGSFTWQGRVDDVVELEVQGNRIYPRVLSGRPVSSARNNMNISLPRREVNVGAELRRGRGRVEVVEQPSSRNNYTAIIRVRDTQGGADDYEIEIYWN
ncbi:MAG: RICIN domain-containing protein [Acidobacteria bacterium]|nr:RICIN domain-containing protein [Acidobacteriota bacterium]